MNARGFFLLLLFFPFPAVQGLLPAGAAVGTLAPTVEPTTDPTITVVSPTFQTGTSPAPATTTIPTTGALLTTTTAPTAVPTVTTTQLPTTSTTTSTPPTTSTTTSTTTTTATTTTTTRPTTGPTTTSTTLPTPPMEDLPRAEDADAPLDAGAPSGRAGLPEVDVPAAGTAAAGALVQGPAPQETGDGSSGAAAPERRGRGIPGSAVVLVLAALSGLAVLWRRKAP